MGTRYLLDTNTAIYFLEGVLPAPSLPFVQSVLDEECNLSIITRIELLGWQFPSTKKESDATAFVNASTILGLTNEIANQVIDIRKNLKIKLPDAIIAATALVHGLELISRNEIDFKSIPGLKIINPFAI
ncbi:MAG: type II toxin-antitoxin system VapC family toxin [Saprospiraceae bacterium]|nr:type II toxin-antitoxin system VapC family toxin [Saprospiraceae bacterium]